MNSAFFVHADEIHDVLDNSRQHLLSTISTFDDADLETVPQHYSDRGWTLAKILEVIAWHEAHHHGQAHLTLNLWKAASQRIDD